MLVLMVVMMIAFVVVVMVAAVTGHMIVMDVHCKSSLCFSFYYNYAAS